MIPSNSRQCRRAQRRAGSRLPVALAASVSALILTALGMPAAFAVPAGYPAQSPSAGATATPDPHASMSGMDPDMPGMDHDETPGMDPDMPGMDHDETPGMDPDMPGMTHDETPGMDPNMPGMSGSGSGHSHAATAAPGSRPQAAVIGTFALLNGGVLMTAWLMRRRSKLTTTKPSRASRPAK